MIHVKYYWILYVYCTSAGIFTLFLFIHKQCEDAREWVLFSDVEPEREFDFIVVGGGSAGSIVAGRLSEDSEAKVLLIEAGGQPSPLHDIPLSGPMIQRTVYDWQYVTVPQETACLGLTDRRSRWPMGKMFGGTSRLNYMMYLRGHYQDFDFWASESDWTLPDVLHYFRKSEAVVGAPFENVGHVKISKMPFATKLSDALISASEELQFKAGDLNRLMSCGVMRPDVTSWNGGRWSADYSLAQLAGPRLRVQVNTLVEKVLLRKGFEAYGVQYRKGSTRGVYYAKKAVIVSAGTIGSPKLLMLSGIGPKNELAQHKIEPLIDLPVGQNLQDHVTTGLDLVLLNETLPFSVSSVLKSPMSLVEYLFYGSGILTHPGCEFVGLFNMSNSSVPDVQLMALPAGAATDGGAVMKDAMGISDQLWNNYFAPLVGQQVVSIIPVVLHPLSRGTVQLSSSNPQDLPRIDPKYLSNAQDVKTLTLGLKLVQRLIKTKAMQRFGARLNTNKVPGCDHLEFGTDEYWDCYVRCLTLTTYHPVGTCKMGVGPDTVVTPELRVRHTNKLFVVDASIMPTLPSANTLAATYMIAEKGADLVKRFVHMLTGQCSSREIFLGTIA